MSLDILLKKLLILQKSKVANNSMILIFSKIIQTVLSFFVSIISAKFLGPSNYGVVSYAGSIITFVTPIAALGLNSILTYECVHNPNDEGKIFGTSLFLQVVSGFLCVLGLAVVAFFLEKDDAVVRIVIILYSLELIFKSVAVIESWFQVHYKAKYVAISTLIAYVSVSAYKIVLLFLQAQVQFFALSMCVDYIVLGALYLIFYFKNGGKKLSFSKAWAKKLVLIGKSFIIAGIMVAAYTQIDRIMLRKMLGEETVGYYTVASSLTSILGFVLASIITASNPIILEHQKVDEQKYKNALIGRFSLIFYFSIALTILYTIFASLIVNILYGVEYQAAIPVVRALTWCPLFTYWGVAKGIWFISQRKQKYIKWLSLVGVLTNIVLNLVLITWFGVVGAAIASVLSEMAVNFITGLFIPEIRECSIMMLKSMNPRMLKNVKLLLE